MLAHVRRARRISAATLVAYVFTLFATAPFWAKAHPAGTPDFHADFCTAALAGNTAERDDAHPEKAPKKAYSHCDHCTGCAGTPVTQSESVVPLAVAAPADVVIVATPPRPQPSNDVVSRPRGPPPTAG